MMHYRLWSANDLGRHGCFRSLNYKCRNMDAGSQTVKKIAILFFQKKNNIAILEAINWCVYTGLWTIKIFNLKGKKKKKKWQSSALPKATRQEETSTNLLLNQGYFRTAKVCSVCKLSGSGLEWIDLFSIWGEYYTLTEGVTSTQI